MCTLNRKTTVNTTVPIERRRCSTDKIADLFLEQSKATQAADFRISTLLQRTVSVLLYFLSKLPLDGCKFKSKAVPADVEGCRPLVLPV